MLGRQLGLIVVAASCVGCLPPLFGEPSVEIEDYDADRGLRALRHERNLDFNWTNPRMQHAVQVTIPLRGGGGSNQCSGVLVGPDLVLTATHCLKGTASPGLAPYLRDRAQAFLGHSGHRQRDRDAERDLRIEAGPS